MQLLLKPRSGNELEVWRARENMTSQSPLVASMNLATTTKRLFESVKKTLVYRMVVNSSKLSVHIERI